MRQPFNETVHFRGEEVARRIWEFALRSVAGLAALLEERGEAVESGLDLSGGYVLAETHPMHEVQASHRALEKAGMPVEWLTGEQVRALTHGKGFHGGYRIEGGGCVDPGAAAEAAWHGRRWRRAPPSSRKWTWGTRAGGGMVPAGPIEGEVKAEMVVYATHVESRRFSGFRG